MVDYNGAVIFQNVFGRGLRVSKDSDKLVWDGEWKPGKEMSYQRFTLEEENGKTAFKTHVNDYLSVTEEGLVTRAATKGSQELFEIVDKCKKGEYLEFSNFVFHVFFAILGFGIIFLSCFFQVTWFCLTQSNSNSITYMRSL